eukprot:1926599-Rhodomonas_salina.1
MSAKFLMTGRFVCIMHRGVVTGNGDQANVPVPFGLELVTVRVTTMELNPWGASLWLGPR